MERSENRRQNTIIFLCWAVYAFLYLGRYDYNANINLIMNDYGVSHADAGLVTTFFFFAYGAGQIVHGILCKYYPKKILFPVVLVASAGINLSVFLGIPFGAIKYLWLLNGILQSSIWPSIILVMSQNLDEVHLHRAMLVTGTTTACGTFLTYGTSAGFVWLGDYKIAFLFGAIMLTAVAVVWICLFRPRQISGQTAETTVPDAVPEQPDASARKKVAKTTLLLIVMFCFLSVGCNLIKDGIQTWVPSILTELYNFPDSLSIVLTLVLPLIGSLSVAFAVWLDRKLKNDSVASFCVLFGAATAFAGLVFGTIDVSFIPVLIGFTSVVFFMHSINGQLTVIVPVFFREEVNPGFLAGLLNGVAYFGSTISSYGLGAVADNSGWNTVFRLIFIVSSGMLAIVTVYYVIRLSLRKTHGK